MHAAPGDGPVLFETSFEQPDKYGELGIPESMIAGEGHTGDASLRFVQRRLRLPTEPIPIDPHRGYELQAAFKAAPGSEGTALFFGFNFFDQEGEPISGFGVLPIPGTQTVLKSAAEAGAREVLVEDPGEAWPREGRIAIAFGANEDYSDIPNATAVAIASVTEERGALRLQLEEPLAGGFAAGTPVRCHLILDPPTSLLEAPEHWEEHSLTITGTALPTDSRREMRSRFWPGTAAVQVRIGFRERESETQGKEVWIDDLRITEVPQ